MNNNILLLGIDGGATKVSGWNVLYDKEKATFSLGALHANRSYSDIPGFIPDFKPVAIQVQLQERDNEAINPTEAEQQQASVYVEACAQVIKTIVQQSGAKQIVVGLGMPGLKTPDKRGIAVVANGPRMVHYSDQLEARLAAADIQFDAPIAHLGSDADYCGIGENHSAQGLFRDIENAYYLGGGTGVADALKLDGKLTPFDATKDWLAKTWEMKSADGRSLERFTSVGGLQAVYAEIADKAISELNAEKIYPLQIAERSAKGEPAAKKMINLAVENLSLMLFERIATLYSGSKNTFEFVNPNRPQLSGDHPFLGRLFDRLIIGQRLGELFDSEFGGSGVRNPVIKRLSELIRNSEDLDDKAKAHYSSLDNILVSSKLREAPAIGAGIDAYFSWKKYHQAKSW